MARQYVLSVRNDVGTLSSVSEAGKNRRPFEVGSCAVNSVTLDAEHWSASTSKPRPQPYIHSINTQRQCWLDDMAANFYPVYPPDLNSEQQEYLLTNLKDWSIAHGLAVRPAAPYVQPQQNPSGALATTAPVTLFPSLFPRACLEQAKSVAKAYNELYSAIACDERWLQEIVEE